MTTLWNIIKTIGVLILGGIAAITVFFGSIFGTIALWIAAVITFVYCAVSEEKDE